MTKKQPFLPWFPTTICGRVRRRLQDVIAARRRALAESSIASYALLFSHVLPAEFLHAGSGTRRRRHFFNVTVFWDWLAQALEDKQLARITIFEYLEAFYNRTRRHSSLGNISPEQFLELHSQKQNQNLN